MANEESVLRTRCNIEIEVLSLTPSTSLEIILVTIGAFLYTISAALNANPLMTQRSALRTCSNNDEERVLN